MLHTPARNRPTDRADRRVRGPDAVPTGRAASPAEGRRQRDRSLRARGADTVRVSLVIPAHDEEDRLPGTLRRYAAALADRYGDAVEILVVANGCSDDTAAAGRRLANEIPGLRVIDIPEPILKGGAVLVGLREALGAAIVFADADGATDEASLLELLEGLDDADVVIGTRHAAGSVIVRGQPLARRVLSRVFNTAVRVLFGLPFRDTQCGAKAFRASAARRLVGAVEERDWTFDLDLILAARRLRLTVAERPVVWTDVEGSHLRAQRVAPAVVRALWRLWWRERAAGARAATRLRGARAATRLRGARAATRLGSARVASQRILALNWRCPRHPEAGGAELNLFEQARRWAGLGHEVTVITARRAGSVDLPPYEVMDGVAVRRMGGRFTVYLRAAWYLLTRGWRYDRILDVANGIPFFAPLFTGRPVALLVHHVHDRQWFAEFPRPVAAVGWLLERWVVPRVYRHRPAIAVSPTTRDALVATGFEPSDVHIVYNGVTAEPAQGAGQRRPTILYVGRIKRYKRLDRLVRVFSELHRRFPEARLVVAGGGDAVEEVEAVARELGLDDAVRFPGVIDEPTKARLLATSTVFATPSMQEGWGLSVIEANFHGTPAVAYDVPGLRSAIRPGETGLLVHDDRGFRDAIARLLEDRALWSRLSANARQWAARFDWDRTAARTLSIMQSRTAGRPSPPHDAHPHRSTARGTIALPLLVAFVWTSLLNYGFGLIASRILGPGDFGLLAFAQSILLLGGLVLQSGVPWTLARDVASAHADQPGGLVRGALLANLGIAAGLAAIVVALYLAGPLRRGLEDTAVLSAVVVALPLIAVTAVARAASQGMSMFGRVGLILGAEVTAKVGAGLALAALGFGVVGALSGFSVGALVAGVIGLAVVAPRISLRGRTVTLPSLGRAAPMFGALLGLALILNLDLQAMKLLSPDRAATGQYQAAIILANAPYFLVSSAIVPVLFTLLASAGSLPETRRRVGEALGVAVAIALPGELLLIAAPDAFLGALFPPAYAGAAPTLRLMAVGNAALIVAVIVATAFQAVDRSSEVGRVLLGIIAVEAVALVLVVPHFGATGAVVAFDAAALAAATILGIRYAAMVRPARAPILSWLPRYLLAVAVGAACAAIGARVSGLPLAIAAGGLGYGASVLAGGLVPAPHVTDVVRAWVPARIRTVPSTSRSWLRERAVPRER